MLMLTASCASNSAPIDSCSMFQYTLVQPTDKLNPQTERSILNNNEVLLNVCNKPMPAPTKESWLKRHFNI